MDAVRCVPPGPSHLWDVPHHDVPPAPLPAPALGTASRHRRPICSRRSADTTSVFHVKPGRRVACGPCPRFCTRLGCQTLARASAAALHRHIGQHADPMLVGRPRGRIDRDPCPYPCSPPPTFDSGGLRRALHSWHPCRRRRGSGALLRRPIISCAAPGSWSEGHLDASHPGDCAYGETVPAAVLSTLSPVFHVKHWAAPRPGASPALASGATLARASLARS